MLSGPGFGHLRWSLSEYRLENDYSHITRKLFYNVTRLPIATLGDASFNAPHTLKMQVGSTPTVALIISIISKYNIP